MARVTVPDSQRFFNRHISWVQFNQRVLEEAGDPGNPLLERVKFLGITASNLDEFVEVRVAGLMQLVEHGNREPDADGRIPEQVLAELTSKIHTFVDEQYECWRDDLVPALQAESVRVLVECGGLPPLYAVPARRDVLQSSDLSPPPRNSGSIGIANVFVGARHVVPGEHAWRYVSNLPQLWHRRSACGVRRLAAAVCRPGSPGRAATVRFVTASAQGALK